MPDPHATPSNPPPQPVKSFLSSRPADFSGGTAGPRTRTARLIIAGLDVVSIMIALCVAAAVRLEPPKVFNLEFFAQFTGGATAQIVLTLIASYVVGIYDLEPRMRRLITCLRVIAAVAISVALASMIYFWAPWWQLWRSIQAFYFVYASLFMISWRLLAWPWISKTVPLIRCILVGSPDDSRYAKELEKHPWIRFEVAQRLNEQDLSPEPQALYNATLVAAANHVVTGANISPKLVPQLLVCKAHGVEVIRLVSIFMSATGRIPVAYIRPDDIAFGPSIALRTSRLHQAVHRAIDLIVSATLLIVLSPLLLLAALAVMIESGLPIFYRQDRVGQDEREFNLMKIRTMVQDAEQPNAPQWSTKKDPRVTRVGRILRRTRIDELPQLINVLRGEMSLIGPRPERRFFVDQLAKAVPYYSLRHSVRPGLTGWAQVNHGYGASTADAQRKLEYDLYYIQESSFLLDCVILLRTVRTVISRPGS